jgi:hypothetical protein
MRTGVRWRSLFERRRGTRAGNLLAGQSFANRQAGLLRKAVIRVKPMAIDPIFWDLVGLPENREQPLSFRANGAWTCRPPYFAELDIEEHTDSAVVADRMIAAATDQLENVLRSYTLDAFLLTCRDGAEANESYLPCVGVWWGVPCPGRLIRRHGDRLSATAGRGCYTALNARHSRADAKVTDFASALER